MKRGVITEMTFKKVHTNKEIAQYLFDPDAPELTLQVKLWYFVFKVIWMAINVIMTLVSVGVIVWMSYPEYVESSTNTVGPDMNFLNVIELICVIFFTVDYIIRFVLTDKTKLKFLIDPANVIDVLTILPYILQLILFSASVRTDEFRIVFLFRTFRIIRLGKYHAGIRLVFQTMKDSAPLLLLFVVMVLLTIVLTSTAFYFAERTRWDSDRHKWMRDCRKTFVPSNCTEEIAPYQSIPEAMYWSIITMSTVGYNSEVPTSWVGHVVAALTAVCGVFFFAAPATVLATNYKMIRRKMDREKRARKMDARATEAMKAQEVLRRELERKLKNPSAYGETSTVVNRELHKICTFEYQGVSKNVFEAEHGTFVYEPICSLLRDDKNEEISFTDDFNLTTAQRVLTASLILDCDECRTEAKNSLIAMGMLEKEISESEVFIGADPNCELCVRHDATGAYQNLVEVVELDHLRNVQGYLQDIVPVKFVINMPHMYPTLDVIRMLRETRLNISLGMRTKLGIAHIPLATANIMASRLVRELSDIAFERETDFHRIAYIHSSDAAALLDGFAEQFIPTAARDILLVDGYSVDHQVLANIEASFPKVRMDCIPPQGANALYRSSQMNIDFTEQKLLAIDLTSLENFDEMGFGHRFRVSVPICEISKKEVQFQIV